MESATAPVTATVCSKVPLPSQSYWSCVGAGLPSTTWENRIGWFAENEQGATLHCAWNTWITTGSPAVTTTVSGALSISVAWRQFLILTLTR